MKRLLILAWLLPCVSGHAQTVDCTQPAKGTHVQASKGSTVTMCFDFPDAARPGVKYFRVRMSQTPAGSYNAVPSLNIPNTRNYVQFVITHSTHVFLSTVWDEKDANGNIIATHESEGSNHCWIEVASTQSLLKRSLKGFLRAFK